MQIIRGVSAILMLPRERRKHGRRGGRKKLIGCQNAELYTSQLDSRTAVLIAEYVWRDTALMDKCDAIDALLLAVAGACKESVQAVRKEKLADPQRAK